MYLERPAVIALAPSAMRNHRPFRYQGDDQAVPMVAFTPEDQAVLGSLYQFLRELDHAGEHEEALQAFVHVNDLDAIAARVSTIGRLQSYTREVAAVAHDLRGGVLSALLLELGAAAEERLPSSSVRELARDCLKQMRNLLADVDPPGRLRDQELRYHSVSDLVSALRNYQGSAKSGRVTLDIDADESATIAASCTEFGTIERVAYNLLENAAMHAPTHAIEASLIAMGDDLRVAVTNPLGEEASARLRELLAGDRALLYSSFSSTGSGIGLQVAAELVGRAYGIDTLADLVEGGYVGTSVVSASFVSWFHWPLARPHPGDPTCR